MNKQRLKPQSIMLALTSAIVIALAPFTSAIDLSAWKTYAPTNNLREFVAFDGEYWAVSEGGVVVITPGSNETRILTNSDGLFANDFSALTVDANNSLWMTGEGWLVKHNAGTSQFNAFAFLDQNNEFIGLNDVADDGDKLWVATSNGLALFSKSISGGQIQDSYQRFGSFPSQAAVVSVALIQDSIWVLTGGGPALAKRTDPLQLKSFANWKSIAMTSIPLLNGLTPTCLVMYNNRVVIGTDDGAFYIDYDMTDTTATSLNLLSNTRVYSMSVEGPNLKLFTSRGVYIHNGTTSTLETFTGVPHNRIRSGISVSGGYLLGIDAAGLFSSTGGTASKISTGAPPGGFVQDIVVAPSGKVYGAFDGNGFAEFATGQWTPISIPTTGRALAVSVDSTQALWCGTFGDGVWRLTNSDTTNFDSLNSSLKGNNDGGFNNFVVIPDIVSGRRYAFFANFRAYNINATSLVDQLDTDDWIGFGVAQGITDEFVTSVDVSPGLLAISSERAGIFRVITNGVPGNPSGYTVTHYSSNAANFLHRIPSDIINVVRISPTGDIWAGHQFGLVRFDPGIERFVELTLPLELGPAVEDIAFDLQGNVWIATPTGLGQFTVATGSFESLTKLNSGIVSNGAKALWFDRIHNQLWIGTDKGVSRYTPNLGQPVFELDDVTAYPNPYVITFGNERLSFNFSGSGTVRMYTESGELVWEGPSAEGWTGRNESGNLVASGVYIFTVTVDGSDTGVGKVLVIRN